MALSSFLHCAKAWKNTFVGHKLNTTYELIQRTQKTNHQNIPFAWLHDSSKHLVRQWRVLKLHRAIVVESPFSYSRSIVPRSITMGKRRSGAETKRYIKGRLWDNRKFHRYMNFVTSLIQEVTSLDIILPQLSPTCVGIFLSDLYLTLVYQ